MRNALICFAAIALAACSSTYGPMSSSTIPGMLSESDIAGILTNANQGEIDQGNAATSRATSADVRAFAQMMVTDHTNALNSARDLFARRGIAAGENDTTRALATGSQQTVSALSTYSGASFDRTYMQAQVDAHAWLLNTLDQQLIPSARSREMRDFLQSTRGTVAAHLDRARQIQSGLR